MECLVTKLKAVVNDDSLRKIGELRVQYAAIESPTPNSQYVGIEIDKSVTLTALGGASFYTTEAFTSMVGEKIFPEGFAKMPRKNAPYQQSLRISYKFIGEIVSEPIREFDPSSIKPTEPELPEEFTM